MAAVRGIVGGILVRRLEGEITNIFIALPSYAVNQLEGKWRRGRARKERRATLWPPGAAGAPEPCSLNSCFSLVRLLTFGGRFSVAVLPRARCYVYSEHRACIPFRSREQPRDMQDSGPLNFSAIALPSALGVLSFPPLFLFRHEKIAMASVVYRDQSRYTEDP